MGLCHSCQVQRHPHAERGLDLYETPSVAVEALLRVERLPHHIWEPACGRGAIVNVLRSATHDVTASDIFDYGFPGSWNCDFLASDTRTQRRASPSSRVSAAATSWRAAGSRACTYSASACP